VHAAKDALAQSEAEVRTLNVEKWDEGSDPDAGGQDERETTGYEPFDDQRGGQRGSNVIPRRARPGLEADAGGASDQANGSNVQANGSNEAHNLEARGGEEALWDLRRRCRALEVSLALSLSLTLTHSHTLSI